MLDQARAVTSRTNPLVSRFRRARSAGATEVLLEGTTLVREALGGGWPVRVLALTDDAAQAPEVKALLEALPQTTELVRVAPRVMDALSPAQTPSGTVALAGVPSTGDVFARRPALLVCAVDVQDPGNLGAIVRAAEAAGATGVVACGASADPFAWKALRGAMGSAFRLPVVRRLAVQDALRASHAASLRVLAATATGTPLNDVDLRGDVALFVGGEGSGLPRAVVEAAHTDVAVPMEPPVESLNVAVATAVILYEARRQRRARL